MAFQGLVQVYTGNGKGKTTAALGLILRACGAGMTVYLGQFLKRAEYSEHASLALLPGVTAEGYGGERRIGDPMTKEDLRLARRGLERLREALASERYGLVVADEIFVAVHTGLLSESDVLSLMDLRPPSTELVLTGRHATEAVCARADLVTEMREIRHYFARGVPARRGIEG